MDPRVPHGPHGWEDHSLSVLPLIGNFVFLLLILALVATGVYLWRTGRLPLGNLGRARPEEDAKRILADRFARGDISTDEFMERSSILNWTPGIDPAPSLRRRI